MYMRLKSGSLVVIRGFRVVLLVGLEWFYSGASSLFLDASPVVSSLLPTEYPFLYVRLMLLKGLKKKFRPRVLGGTLRTCVASFETSEEEVSCR